MKNQHVLLIAISFWFLGYLMQAVWLPLSFDSAYAGPRGPVASAGVNNLVDSRFFPLLLGQRISAVHSKPAPNEVPVGPPSSLASVDKPAPLASNFPPSPLDAKPSKSQAGPPALPPPPQQQPPRATATASASATATASASAPLVEADPSSPYAQLGSVVFLRNPKIEDNTASYRGEGLAVSQSKTFYYGPWALRWPHFVRQEDENWFRGCGFTREIQSDNKAPRTEPIYQAMEQHFAKQGGQWFVFNHHRYLHGEALIGHNATTSLPHECGYTSEPRPFLRGTGKTKEVERMLFMHIPACWAFQHFVDSSLPKMVQLVDAFGRGVYNSKTHVFAELDSMNRFPIVLDLYNEFAGIPSERVISDLSQRIFVRELLYACKAPPLHPYLWHRVRDYWGLPFKPLQERKRVIYLSRGDRGGGAGNPGRRVKNEEEAVETMRTWLEKNRPDLRLEFFNYKAMKSLREVMEFFAGARAIIGPHGGALTNLVWAGSRTLIVELFALRPGSMQPPLGHPGMMYYLQSSMLDMEYWILTALCDGTDNIEVDIPSLQRILDKTLAVQL